MKKILFGSLIAGALFFGLAKNSLASEGTFDLRNRVGDDARCSAYSVLMQDLNYNILLSCRDILYPGGQSVFTYVVWAVPSTGGNHFKLGTIGLGKVAFKTKTPFSSMYVTKESEANTRTPSGQIIMQGSLNTNQFLDGSTKPAPETKDEQIETEPTPIATKAPTNLGRIFAAGGILAFIAIFGVILVIFVVTRK